MALSLLTRRQGRQFINVVQARCYGGHGSKSELPLPLQKVDIGKREIVGFGHNGEITYFDSVMHPFPAIRFKEDAGDITALREKEKGDWKKMTVEEKKALYRASFCQTLAEVEAPTGEWKSIIGIALIGLSLGLWGFLFLAVYAYEPVSDSVTNPERVKAQFDRMVAIRVDPVYGFTSNYDYEKGQWKK